MYRSVAAPALRAPIARVGVQRETSLCMKKNLIGGTAAARWRRGGGGGGIGAAAAAAQSPSPMRVRVKDYLGRIAVDHTVY